LYLDTLIDTVIPINFVKEGFISNKIVKNCRTRVSKFKDINGSELRVIGQIKAKVYLENAEKECNLLVVFNNTMQTPAVLGRNILKRFGYRLKRPSDQNCAVNEETLQILNVDAYSNVSEGEITYDINQEISGNMRNRFVRLFKEYYINRERPKEPRIKVELDLQLREHQPFHFAPRQNLSYAER